MIRSLITADPKPPRNLPGLKTPFTTDGIVEEQGISETPTEFSAAAHRSVIHLPSPPARQRPGKTRRKGQPGKRGPKGSTFIPMAQVREIDGLAHRARRDGCAFNLCITVRAPLGVSDADGKRFIDRHLKHIGQALRDRGQVWLAVWVYEKSPHLHVHALVYVAPRNLALVRRRHEGPGGMVHIRSADPFGPEYVTKQRKWRGPIEAVRRRLWKPCAWIDGPRVGYSKAAKALLGRAKGFEPIAVRAGGTSPVRPVAGIPTVTLAPPVGAVQMGLPLDWTPGLRGSDAALMERFCRHFSYTQQLAAEQLGYSARSHVANILRGHDGMSPTRRKWLQHCLEKTGMVPA